MAFPLSLIGELNLSINLLKEIADAILREELPKGAFLFRRGELCRKIFYIEKGVARAYYASRKGKEITAWFSTDNNFMTALDSFSGNTPTSINCELLEPSIVFSIEFSQLEALLKSNPELGAVAFHVAMKFLKTHSDYIASIKLQSAKERFDTLMNDFPSIFLRVPLGHIASYLGITQETLSRMRAQNCVSKKS